MAHSSLVATDLAGMDEGFKGYYTEEGVSAERDRHRSINFHFLFGGDNKLEGGIVLSPAAQALIVAAAFPGHWLSLLLPSGFFQVCIQTAHHDCSYRRDCPILPLPTLQRLLTSILILYFNDFFTDATAYDTGYGLDSYGQFLVSGQYTGVDVSFTVQYVTQTQSAR